MASGDNYDVLNNIDVSNSFKQLNLIGSYKNLKRFNCLFECTRNQLCLSSTYINTISDIQLENCFMFKKVPNSSDYVTSNDITLFKVKG